VDALPAPKTNLLNIHPDPTGKLFVCSSKGKHPGFGKSHAEAIGAYIAMNSGDFPIEINVSNEARALADKISDKKAAKQAKKDKKRRKK
jgi:hypothetical protein